MNLATWLDRVFSDRFVNQAAVAGNPLLLAMYRFAYPFALALSTIGLTPNLITTFSLIAALMAFAGLALGQPYQWFGLFWGLAVLLDFCDGTVARMTNRVSKSAFRYDHMSDIFKLSLIVLGVGIYLDNKAVWILCCTFIFFFTYFEIVAHDLKNTLLRNQNSSVAPLGDARTSEGVRSAHTTRGWINKYPGVKMWLRAGYVVLTSFNGHTLLVFFLLPVGGDVTVLALSYLITLCVAGSVNCINSLRRLQR